MLVDAYRRHIPAQTVAATILGQLDALQDEEANTVSDLVFCPGLTEGALLALSHYFTQFVDQEVAAPVPLPRRGINGQAAVVVRYCFAREWCESAYYLRLQPLCESLGRVLARPANWGDYTPGVQMADVLRAAPLAAAAGPLRSWIDAFARRDDEGRLSAGEREALELTIRDAALRDAADSRQAAEFAAVFAPLIKRLRVFPEVAR
jgi:hypothetical protein